MLPIPTDTETTSCVIGLDPGTVKLGVCRIEFKVDSFEILRISAFTLDGDKLPSSEWLGQIYGDRARRVSALAYYLEHYFKDEEPFGVASESPFYNQKRPNAYGALMEVICALREAVKKYTIRKPLYLIDPPTVKRAIGAAGNADKEAVKKAILLHPELSKLTDRPIGEHDEHSLDAMAVAFCLLKNYSCGKMDLQHSI